MKRPPAKPVAVAHAEPKSYRTAQTRAATRQLSGHFPAVAVQAFRVLAAKLDMDVQELLGEAISMTFERLGVPNRSEIASGRRKRDEQFSFIISDLNKWHRQQNRRYRRSTARF